MCADGTVLYIVEMRHSDGRGGTFIRALVILGSHHLGRRACEQTALDNVTLILKGPACALCLDSSCSLFEALSFAPD